MLILVFKGSFLGSDGQPLTVEVSLRSQATPCDICNGQSGTGAEFSLGISVFPCQYHSTNSQYISMSQQPFWARAYWIGLLCPSDQLIAETSFCQPTRDRHSCFLRDSNPPSQKASGRRPSPWTALLHSHLYPCFAFTSRTNGPSLRTFRLSNALSHIRDC